MTPDKFTTDRDDAIKWARKLFDEGEFIIFDTETTGLDSAAEIMQFAFVNHNDTNSIQFDVCPTERATLDERAFRVHGITLESVATAPPITIWADNITEIIKGKTVIGWNIPFDYRMLIQSFNAWGAEPPAIIHLANFECAMLQYSKFVGDWDAKRGGYRWQKLPFATHGALADCRATLNVLHEMAAARLSDEPSEPVFDSANTTDSLSDLPPAPVRTVAFEHGHGVVTLGPAPESTSTAVEVELHDDGTDPAANGYTFNLFEVAAEGATDEQMSEYFVSLTRLLNTVGAHTITIQDVSKWTSDQRVAAATWAAKTAGAQLDLSLNGHGEFPTWPEFFPAGDIPF